MCLRHRGCLWGDVGFQTPAISEGQMGPSRQHGCLVAQSTMAPVQTSRTTTTNRTPVCVCLCGRVRLSVLESVISCQTYLMLHWIKGSVCHFSKYCHLSVFIHCRIRAGGRRHMTRLAAVYCLLC